eukprot:NODE_336_length_9298_cov_0.577889.p2 type:complete len:462 gc:universal NODE_336_length_9298_cov_0.577889:7276-5891(-)
MYTTELRNDSSMEDGNNTNIDTILSRWCEYYFPNQLPDIFTTFNERDLNSVKNESIFFDYLNLTHLKSFRTSLSMKLLHPTAYLALCEAIKSKIFDNVPNVLDKPWRKCKYVYCATNSEMLKNLRRSLMRENEYISRFDIIRFYHSFYTHAFVWIASGSRAAGKNAYDSKTFADVKWADNLDNAIELCQWKQTRGIPIGSKVIDELAESFLILLDAIIIERAELLNINKSQYVIIRSVDNYEIIAVSGAICTKIERICVEVILEFELNVSFESDWSHERISRKNKTNDLLFRITEEPIESCLDILLLNNKSMDYGYALDICIGRLMPYIEEANYHKYLVDILRNHPKSVKFVMGYVSKSSNVEFVTRVSDFLYDNLDDFLFGGITCQFVCILEFVRLQFAKIGPKWLDNNSPLVALEAESKYNENVLFEIYMISFRELASKPVSPFPKSKLISLLANKLRR